MNYGGGGYNVGIRCFHYGLLHGWLINVTIGWGRGEYKQYIICYLLTEESALSEPAWKNAGQKVGLQIWRIMVGSHSNTLNMPGFHACICQPSLELFLPHKMIVILEISKDYLFHSQKPQQLLHWWWGDAQVMTLTKTNLKHFILAKAAYTPTL